MQIKLCISEECIAKLSIVSMRLAYNRTMPFGWGFDSRSEQCCHGKIIAGNSKDSSKTYISIYSFPCTAQVFSPWLFPGIPPKILLGIQARFIDKFFLQFLQRLFRKFLQGLLRKFVHVFLCIWPNISVRISFPNSSGNSTRNLEFFPKLLKEFLQRFLQKTQFQKKVSSEVSPEFIQGFLRIYSALTSSILSYFFRRCCINFAKDSLSNSYRNNCSIHFLGFIKEFIKNASYEYMQRVLLFFHFFFKNSF